MDDNATAIESLFEKAEDYGKTSIELFKLNAIDKSAEIISSLVEKLVIFLVLALFVLVVNIGIALWLGEILGKTYYGFFIISAFYGLLALILHLFRHEWIKYPVSNSIITKMLKQKLL
ncbi:MAG: hypothetical protein M3Q56_09275 [Bacteroidota bacterium]|nr:hypothetical protein [Bacteroidota bacterium]